MVATVLVLVKVMVPVDWVQMAAGDTVTPVTGTPVTTVSVGIAVSTSLAAMLFICAVKSLAAVFVVMPLTPVVDETLKPEAAVAETA